MSYSPAMKAALQRYQQESAKLAESSLDSSTLAMKAKGVANAIDAIIETPAECIDDVMLKILLAVSRIEKPGECKAKHTIVRCVTALNNQSIHGAIKYLSQALEEETEHKLAYDGLNIALNDLKRIAKLGS